MQCLVQSYTLEVTKVVMKILSVCHVPREQAYKSGHSFRKLLNSYMIFEFFSSLSLVFNFLHAPVKHLLVPLEGILLLNLQPHVGPLYEHICNMINLIFQVEVGFVQLPSILHQINH